jgi:hypothetical protein
MENKEFLSLLMARAKYYQASLTWALAEHSAFYPQFTCIPNETSSDSSNLLDMKYVPH